MISGFYVTTKGQNYITRAMTDRALVFTRGEFGNGIFPTENDPRAVTGLVNKLGDLPLFRKTAEGNNVIVTTQFSNRVNGAILPGFKLTEVALYGKLQTYDGESDQEGPEALLFYGYTTEDKADYIDAILTEYLINFPLTTSSAATVEITIDKSLVYPTIKDFDKLVNAVDKLASFVLKDVMLTKDLFTGDTTYADYPYKATLTIEGVTEDFISDVVFSPAEAEAGIFASVTRTDENTLTLYARKIPDGDITIPTIEFRHADGTLTPGGDPGSGEGINSDNIATDEEAEDAIDDVFGDGSSDEGTDGDVATDEEVGDVIDDIFGDGSNEDAGGDDEGGGESSGDIATDEEVKDTVDDVFGSDDTETGGGTEEPGGESGGTEEPDGGETGGDNTGDTEDGGTGDDTTGETDDNVATDEEVKDVIDDIFG